MAKAGVIVTALREKPDVSPNTQFILDVNFELMNFGGDLNSYCEFYSIYDVNERNYLSRCVSISRRIMNKYSQSEE